MHKTKTLLAAAILSLIAFAGYSQAQTTGGTSAVTGTVALTPEQVLSGSAATFITAKDWPDLVTLAQPFIIGSYIPVAPVNGYTDAQQLNNQAINYVIRATQAISGVQAAHDYAVSKQHWGAAANLTLTNLKNPKAAITELQNAINLNPASTGLKTTMLLYQAKAGQNVNAAIVSYIKSQPGMLPSSDARNLYAAFNTPQASETDLLAFYNLMLQSVESNQSNAAFIGKLLDQKNKLTK